MLIEGCHPKYEILDMAENQSEKLRTKGKLI